MRGHAIEDILKHFGLLVKCLTHFPLQQVHIPQMALSQHPVQHYRWRCFHLHRHSPTSQRIPISNLDGTELNLCIYPCVKNIVYYFRICSWLMTLGLLKCKNMYKRKKQNAHCQRYNTNLLIVELCVIRAAARHPVFGLFPGLFKKVLKSPFHVSLVRSIIIFKLLAQLTNCGCM